VMRGERDIVMQDCFCDSERYCAGNQGPIAGNPRLLTAYAVGEDSIYGIALDSFSAEFEIRLSFTTKALSEYDRLLWYKYLK
jgi:hypothetical protein